MRASDLEYTDLELLAFQLVFAVAFIIYLYFKNKGWW